MSKRWKFDYDLRRYVRRTLTHTQQSIINRMSEDFMVMNVNPYTGAACISRLGLPMVKVGRITAQRLIKKGLLHLENSGLMYDTYILKDKVNK